MQWVIGYTIVQGFTLKYDGLRCQSVMMLLICTKHFFFKVERSKMLLLVLAKSVIVSPIRKNH